MPFQSKAQLRFMYWKHPEIARRWVKKYKQNLKALPNKKKKLRASVYEFAYGQVPHPSPAAPVSAANNPSVAATLVAQAVAKVATPQNRRLRASKFRAMLKVAKRVRHRLKKMGLFK